MIRLGRWYLWSVSLFISTAKYTSSHKVECRLEEALLWGFLLSSDYLTDRSLAHRLVINHKLRLSSLIYAFVFFLGLGRRVCRCVDFYFLKAFIFVSYFWYFFGMRYVCGCRFLFDKNLFKRIFFWLEYSLCSLCCRLRTEAEGCKSVIICDGFCGWLNVKRGTAVSSTCG